MSVVVTDQGFSANTWPENPVSLAVFDAGDETLPAALDLPADTAPETLAGRVDGLAFIRILVSSFADGRGFTLARELRRLGFAGRLRICGPLIADQYAMARRSGCDEVEIPEALAARQPEADWLARADWQGGDYQSTLRARSRASAH
ncbi:MAG: DUF934 domain-containing protein [Rhodobacteraceae bacterium]|nr:MAG: DUF934 domain-containing protein [Paracoccaceae bacterium]